MQLNTEAQLPRRVQGHYLHCNRQHQNGEQKGTNYLVGITVRVQLFVLSIVQQHCKISNILKMPKKH